MENNVQTTNPEVQALAGSAFGRGLGSVIMACFPILSIFAIIMGCKATKLVAQAHSLAAQYGISAGGKCVAAKILGTIGKIAGIIMTIFWVLYIFIIVAAVASAM